jgi:hypothetical protein
VHTTSSRPATVVFDFADRSPSIFVDESPLTPRISVLAPTYHRRRVEVSFNLRIVEHLTIPRHAPRTSLCFVVPKVLLVSKPRETPCKTFCTTEGIYPLPFLRDRFYLDDVAAAARAEVYRIASISLHQSRVGKHYTDYPHICRIRDPLYP